MDFIYKMVIAHKPEMDWVKSQWDRKLGNFKQQG